MEVEVKSLQGSILDLGYFILMTMSCISWFAQEKLILKRKYDMFLSLIINNTLSYFRNFELRSHFISTEKYRLGLSLVEDSDFVDFPIGWDNWVSETRSEKVEWWIWAMLVSSEEFLNISGHFLYFSLLLPNDSPWYLHTGRTKEMESVIFPRFRHPEGPFSVIFFWVFFENLPKMWR